MLKNLVLTIRGLFVFSYYLIYVASLGTTLSKAKRKLKEISPSRSRRAINTNERDDVYIAGKLNASVVPTIFKVGRGQIENDYTNKRLKLGHFYAFSIQSCVLNENSVCIFIVVYCMFLYGCCYMLYIFHYNAWLRP